MDLENLRTFHTVAEYKSFQKAADILLVTQSGISRRIQALENELGVPLFLRTPQSVTLTKQGVEFLPYAERIIRILEEGTKTIKGVRREELTIAVSSSTYNFLPELFKAFIAKHPAHLIVYSSTSQEVYEMLIDQSVDLGITPAIFPSPQIKYERIFSEDLVCVGNPDFLKSYTDNGIIIKSPIPFIIAKMHTFKTHPWNSLNESIETNPLLKIIVEVNFFHLARGLALNGTGLTILPYSDAKESIASGDLLKVSLPNINLPSRPSYMATYKKHHKNKLVVQFQKIARQFSETLLSQENV